MRAVLERDFLAAAVRRRSFLARVAVASMVAAVILLVLEDNHRYLESDPDRLAQWLFVGGGIALLSLMALLTPPAVVGSVLEERQRETLALVLSTPVGPRGFALAKLLARCGTVLAWALAAAVPLAMVLTMGGVAAGQVLDLGILCVAVVLELAAWSLWISTVSRKTATALVLAFLLPILRWTLFAALWGAAVFPHFPYDVVAPRGPEAWAPWVAGNTTPAPALLKALAPDEYDRTLARSFTDPDPGGPAEMVAGVPIRTGNALPAPPPPVLLHPAPLYLVFAAAAALLSVLLSGRRLAVEGEPPRAGPLARWRGIRRSLRPPPGEGNPVAWKESRLLNTAASRPLYYTVLGLLVAGEIVYLLLAEFVLEYPREHGEAAAGFVAAFAPLLGLVSVVGCAAALAHERATGTLDLVRVSRLTAPEFFRGKVLGAFLGPALLVPLLHLSVTAVGGLLDPATAAVGLLQVLLAVAFWGVVGIHCGLAAPRIGAAVTRAVLAFGTMLVALPLVAAMFAAIFRERDLAEFLVAGCPPATAWLTMEASLRKFHPGWSDLLWFRRLNDEQEWAVFCSVLLLVRVFLGFVVARGRAARLWETERGEG